MSEPTRDPLADQLDRLAALADLDTTGDRMPGIRHRVRRNRQRRAAAMAGVAAVALLAGGGVWQGALRADQAPPVTTPTESVGQRIDVRAEPVGPDHVQISFAVSGASTAYVDATTGAPVDYAGPRNTEVSVDGEPVTGSDGGAVECRAGEPVLEYARAYLDQEPFLVRVAGPGIHTIEVRAPYCDDGRIVDDVAQAQVVTDATALAVIDTRRADVDGDGAPDRLTLLAPPPGEPGDQRLVLDRSGGGATSISWENDLDSGLSDPIDLDGNGASEPVVLSGGGEYARQQVFVVRDGLLSAVAAKDADGTALELTSAGGTDTWQTILTADGVLSYRFAGDDLIAPAPLQVLRWALDGTTLTRNATSVPGCWVEQGQGFGPSLGACP